MEPRNISTQVNYSFRPHVYWLNTFGHLSKRKKEEEKNNSTAMPGLWFTSLNILITREDSLVKPHLHVYWLKGRSSATSPQVNISFFILSSVVLPRIYSFTIAQCQWCVCVAADWKSIRWCMYKRVKYWMEYGWILVHWYRFW